MTSAQRKLFIALFILAFCYGLALIHASSAVIGNERYFFLTDDEMISMRYAKNFAAGHGLVWNIGEKPVEGFSNPLWVFLMAGVHMLPIVASKVSLVIQLICLVLTLVTMYFSKKLLDEFPRPSFAAGFSAALLTGFYYPFLAWSLLGTEFSLLACLYTGAAYLAARCVKSGVLNYSTYIMLGLALLTRIDAIVVFTVICGFLILFDRRNLKAHILLGIATLFSCLGIPTLARYLYYADILPNTYYLKIGAVPIVNRIQRGLWLTLQFAFRLNFILLLFPFLVLLRHGGPAILLSSLIFFAELAYNVATGGDAWEPFWPSRYVTAAMPIFFSLFAYAVFAFKLPAGRQAGALSMLARSSILVIALLSFSLRSRLEFFPWITFQKSPYEVTDGMEYANYGSLGNSVYIQAAAWIDSITDPKATVAVVWAGIMPYFSGRTYIDLLGKNDRVIAHGPSKVDPLDQSGAGFRPGHNKWDLNYSILTLKPDVIVQTWGNANEWASATRDYLPLSIDGYQFLVRKNSPYILWQKLKMERTP